MPRHFLPRHPHVHADVGTSLPTVDQQAAHLLQTQRRKRRIHFFVNVIRAILGLLMLVSIGLILRSSRITEYETARSSAITRFSIIMFQFRRDRDADDHAGLTLDTAELWRLYQQFSIIQPPRSMEKQHITMLRTMATCAASAQQYANNNQESGDKLLMVCSDMLTKSGP